VASERERLHRGEGELVDREVAPAATAAETAAHVVPAVPPAPPPPPIRHRPPSSWLQRRR